MQEEIVGMKLIIWGCGYYGKRILTQLVKMSDINIIGYTDNDLNLWGKKIGAFSVFPPSELKELEVDQILIAVNNPKYVVNIKRQLMDKGISVNCIKDIFFDKQYFDLLIDRRINFIIDYSRWIYENHIEGSVAECGVFRGDSAKYLNKFFPDRKLYLCDTFEGFQADDLKNEKENSSSIFLRSKFASENFFQKPQ